MKDIKAALFRKLQVMESQHRFEEELNRLEWLLDIAETPEQCEEVLAEISRMTGETRAQIIERGCIENGYETTQTGL